MPGDAANSLSPPRAIVVDWGTSSLRASLVGQNGNILAEHSSNRGIQVVAAGAFETELMAAVGTWFDEQGPLPVIASGMVTSRNGWVEVAYVPCPAGPADLARGAERVELANGAGMLLLPGMTDRARAPFPDVMRGEETQVVGFGMAGDTVVVLPGTHSKWARVAGGRIATFQTFVTGELFALLTAHSFIAGSKDSDSPSTDWETFDRGVEAALSQPNHAGGMLSLAFSVRTGMLAGQLKPAEIKDYLSGLLIASELREARAADWFEPGRTAGLVANAELSARYERAAAAAGLTLHQGHDHPAVRGALTIAAAATGILDDVG